MKKMDLYQGVTTLEQFETLVKRNIYPLVVVLDEIEKELLEELKDELGDSQKFSIIKILEENYLNECGDKKNANEYYIKLNPNHLKKGVQKEQIRLKRLITHQNDVQYIDCFFISDIPEKSVMIGCHPKKILRNYQNRGEHNVLSIIDLTRQAIEQYQRGNEKRDITYVK